MGFYIGPIWVNPNGTHLIMSGYQSHKIITTFTFILREIKQIVSFSNIVEDGRTAPGVCGSGSVPLSHSGDVVTRTGIHTPTFNIVLSPGQNYMCVENKMTNYGPMWAPHGLKFQYRAHIGPFWALCPDSAHMGPIFYACWESSSFSSIQKTLLSHPNR